MVDLAQATIGSVVFRDGLGDRLVAFDRESGRPLELLRPRPETAALEGLLAERVGRLAEFSDRRFARLHGLTRDPATGGVFVVSDRVEGERLSEVLERARACRLVPDLTAALHVASEALQALATFDRTCRATHGALSLERVVVTSSGRVVLVDHAFAPVLDRLGFSHRFLWRELHLAMPPEPEPVRFDARADVAQVAVILVELALGRRLADDEYPDRLPELAGEVQEIAGIRGGSALAAAVGDWLEAALPAAGSIGFASAAEAHGELERTLPKDPSVAGSRHELREFIEQLADAEATEHIERPQRTEAVPDRQAIATDSADTVPEPAVGELGEATQAELFEIQTAQEPPLETAAAERVAAEGAAAEEIGPEERPASKEEVTFEEALVFDEGVAFEEEVTLGQEGPLEEEGAQQADLSFEARTAGHIPADEPAEEQSLITGDLGVESIAAQESLAEASLAEPILAEAAAVTDTAAADELVEVDAHRGVRSIEVEEIVRPADETAPAEEAAPEEPATGAESAEPVTPVPTVVAQGAVAADSRGAAFDFAVPPAERGEGSEPTPEAGAALADIAVPGTSDSAATEMPTLAQRGETESRTPSPGAGALETPRFRLIADLDVAKLPEWMLEPEPEPTTRAIIVSSASPPPLAPPASRAPTWTHVAEPKPEPVADRRTEPLPLGAPPLVQPPAEEPVGERVERTKRFVQDLLARRRDRPAGRGMLGIERSAEPPVEPVAPARLPSRPRVRVRRLATAAVLLVALAAGATMAARWVAARRQPGSLVLDSAPPGSEIILDGERRGLTPLVLTVKPGVHTLELRWQGRTRTFSLEVAPGAQITQALDWGRLVDTGGLRITSDPSGAQVLVDGRLRGQTPLELSDLRVGRHTVVVRADTGSVTERVSVQANEVAALDVLIYPGWMAVFAPVELEIFERGRRLGASSDGRIVVPPGRHEVELVSEEFGYRATQTLEVRPGAVASVSVEPKAPVSLSATPWAHVFLDGQFLGETPLVDVPVTIGTREFVFRHPQYGERRVVAVVTLREPVQVSVDMTR